MNYILYKIFISLFLIKLAILYPTITLKIMQNYNLIDEIELNFQFYMKYIKILSPKEFSSIYKFSYISEESKYTPFLKNKKEKQILLFNSFTTFSSIKSCNMSNIIIFPDNFIPILNKELLIHFESKQFIFFVDQKEYDKITKYDFNDNEDIYVKIFIPKEISKNFEINTNNITIPEYYFILMFLSFIIFFFYLFHYNFLVPLLYKDFWLFFISQFYLFIPLRFILLVLLSIKLMIIQNMRGLLPSAPGFFVILAVQKSLIKTNIITTILLANEGLYIFENMKNIIKKMTIYKLQFFFLTIFLILLLSFPFNLVIIILDCVIIPIISIHALINYKKLKKTLKIAYLTNKRYIPFIKLKLSIWIKQNILLSIYFVSLILIYFYSKYTTNKMLVDEIICLKNDMLEYCVENLFLFAFCYLYRPRHLERHFFIVYTERFGAINLKFYYTELEKKNNIRNKLIDTIQKETYINKKKLSNFRIENIKKPIIILHPRMINKIKDIRKNNKKNSWNKLDFNDKFMISIGKVK